MKYLLICALCLLTACATGAPQREENKGSGSTLSTLITHEGCAAYRPSGEFDDVYRVHCQGNADVQTQSISHAGKVVRTRNVTTSETPFTTDLPEVRTPSYVTLRSLTPP